MSRDPSSKLLPSIHSNPYEQMYSVQPKYQINTGVHNHSTSNLTKNLIRESHQNMTSNMNLDHYDFNFQSKNHSESNGPHKRDSPKAKAFKTKVMMPNAGNIAIKPIDQ